MPSKSASKGEIEVVFGFKQVLGTSILAIFLLGCAYLLGYERGHERALQGKPSLLAILERGSSVPGGPVAIPDVLLDPADDQPSGSGSGESAAAPVPEAKPERAATGEPEAPLRTAREPSGRVKPAPGIRQVPVSRTASAPPSQPEPEPPTQSRPAESVRPPANAGRGGKLHYQVAALSQRSNAKALADWLRSEGFQARIHPASGDGLFRVLVGPFRDDQDAERARDRLSKGGFELMARRF